jgi:hypothetical protein
MCGSSAGQSSSGIAVEGDVDDTPDAQDLRLRLARYCSRPAAAFASTSSASVDQQFRPGFSATVAAVASHSFSSVSFSS